LFAVHSKREMQNRSGQTAINFAAVSSCVCDVICGNLSCRRRPCDVPYSVLHWSRRTWWQL